MGFEFIGVAGTGAFTQSGGTHTVAYGDGGGSSPWGEWTAAVPII